MPDEQAEDDSTLVKEAKRGNAEAFGELYERHAPRIFRFLFAHLENRLDAEDLTEEVFLKAWRALPKYRDQGIPFPAFLFRIANNTLIDHYRSRSRSNNHATLEANPLPDPCPEPMDQVAEQLERQELHRTLGKLKKDYRTVLAARYLANLSSEETARMMGKSAGAVRVLQHRALAALRKLLDE